MDHKRARFLVWLDKNRTTIALMFGLPFIALLFWLMYSATIDSNGRKANERQQAVESTAELQNPEHGEPPRSKPDVTAILGFKKTEPKKVESVQIVTTRESAGQAGAPGYNRQQVQGQQQAPDPYPDAR